MNRQDRSGARPVSPPWRPVAAGAWDYLRRNGGLIGLVASILITVVVPIVGSASLLAQRASTNLAISDREQVGIAFTERVGDVARSLRRWRDQVAIRGPATGANRLAVERALTRLYDYNDEAGRILNMTKRLKRVEDRWASIPFRGPILERIDEMLDLTNELFYFIDDRSSLVADPDATTANLIDLYGVQLPSLIRAVDEERDVLLVDSQGGGGRQSFASGAASVLEQRQDESLRQAETDLELGRLPPEQDAPIFGALRHLRDRMDVFRANVAQSRANGQVTPAMLATLRANSDATLDAAYGATAAVRDRLVALLDERSRREQRELDLIRAEALFGSVLGVLLAGAFVWLVRDRHRRELQQSMAEAGRLSAELDQRRTAERLSITRVEFEAVFERTALGVALLDLRGRPFKTNQTLRKIFAEPGPQHVGATDERFRSLIDGEIPSYTTELLATGESTPRWFEATLSLVSDDDGEPSFVVSMLKDVTERRHSEDRLRHEATHDALTGLPNRVLFFERMRMTFFGGTQPPGTHAIVFVDLDDFKFINDSLGHEVGDNVLAAIAERLESAVGPSDFVARFGGDEFVVILIGRDNRDEVLAVAQRVARMLAEPLVVNGREMLVTSSSGVALLHRYYRTTEEIVHDADTAMYYAKTSGRARYAVFDGGMREEASRKLEIGTHLRRALERDQLYLEYQPVVSLKNGRIQSFEVLLRWEHPEFGLLAPSEFIPVAEEIGLIVPIGRWVLERACGQLARWRTEESGFDETYLAVNASVHEILQVDYCDFVERTLARHGLRPGSVVLEVTESAVLKTNQYAAGALERLKAIGVGLAIDDFGTGYSSLTYLREFPFDHLKIDASFVAGTDGRLASESIVSMLVKLGNAFGVSVVAEGVETQAQAERLRELGCDFAQGFLFRRPQPASLVAALLDEIPLGRAG